MGWINATLKEHHGILGVFAFWILVFLFVFLTAETPNKASIHSDGLQNWDLLSKDGITVIYDNESKYASYVEDAAKQYNTIEPIFSFFR